MRDMNYYLLECCGLFLPIHTLHNLLETIEPCFQILDDFECQGIRIGQVFHVAEAIVFEPEDIEVCLASVKPARTRSSCT